MPKMKIAGKIDVSTVSRALARRPVRNSVLGLLASTALFSLAPRGAEAVDCTNPTAITGDGACTNAQTLNSSSAGQATISATGNLDLTNTATGQIGAGSAASAVAVGGGLTLNNAGNILTLSGGSNYTVRSGTAQAGVTTITNSGLIGDQATTNGGASNAIVVGSFASAFTLNNTATGVIKSTSAVGGGVQSLAATDTITNAGTIQGGGSGTALYLQGFTTATVNNSGSINSQAAPAGNGFAVSSAGTLSLTNSGGIWGTSALYLSGGVAATINNTGGGTISGTTNVIDIQSSSATITNDGTISGTGAPTVVRSNVNYKPAINVSSGSSLTLTNRGTISALGAGIKVSSGAVSASITNSGTISATSTSAPAQVKVSGIYLDNTTGGTTVTNSGTISGAQYGVYLNSGAMTLSNSGTISGGTSAVFLNTGGSTFNIYNGAVFTNGIDYNNTTGNTTNFYTGSYTLGVKKYATGTNTIKLFGANTTLVTTGLDNTGTGNIVIVDNSARVYSAAAASSVVNYTSSVVSDILLQDVGVSEVIPQDVGADAAPPVAPTAYTNARRVSDKTSRASTAFAEVLGSSGAAKATDLVLQGSGQTVDKYGNLVWARAFGGAQFNDPYGTASGQRSYSGGAMFGYDWHTDGWRVGGFAGLGRVRTNQTLSSDYVTTDTVYGGVYGRRSLGNFNLDATLAGGSLNEHTRRFVNNGTEIARGDFNGYLVSPEAALGYNIDLADGLTATPTGRFRYVGAFLNGYTETGSSQNVTYGSSFSNTLEERAEMRVTKTVKSADGLASSFYVQAAAIAAQRVGPANFSASVLGTSFAVGDGYARSKAGMSLGAGFTYKVAPQFDLYGSLDGAAFTDKSYSVSARGGFKVAF
jgi:outer membrane autotransporter protein